MRASRRYTLPWEGWEIAGWPVMTILHGRVAVENGQLHTGPSEGKLLARTLDSAARTGLVL